MVESEVEAMAIFLGQATAPNTIDRLSYFRGITQNHNFSNTYYTKTTTSENHNSRANYQHRSKTACFLPSNSKVDFGTHMPGLKWLK
jgi:hypothetical protein